MKKYKLHKRKLRILGFPIIEGACPCCSYEGLHSRCNPRSNATKAISRAKKRSEKQKIKREIKNQCEE